MSPCRLPLPPKVARRKPLPWLFRHPLWGVVIAVAAFPVAPEPEPVVEDTAALTKHGIAYASLGRTGWFVQRAR